MRAQAWALVGMAAVVLAAGCSRPEMKATPFYTGEFARPEGPPEDRVNLWPLAYYRKPALSVLWPVGEVTDDHVAVRPVWSVYKLDKDKQQWNFAATLVQLDFDTGDHRVPPVLWGKDYFVVLPLVWLFPNTSCVFPVFWWDSAFAVFPLAWYKAGEYCHLFPLWLHRREADGHDTHVLWPFGRVVDTAAKKGFRAWPLLGLWRGKDWRHAYALWPLLHDRKEGDEHSRIAFPVFFQHEEKGEGWWLLLPLAYHQRDRAGAKTLTPIVSAGRKGEKTWEAVLPLLYHEKDPQGWMAVTPVWMAGKERDAWWTALLPLLYHKQDGQDRLTLTPLWMAGREGAFSWMALLPLFYRHQAGASSLTLTPLWMAGQEARSSWQALLPLFYRRQDERGSLTLTPVWMAGKEGERGWMAVPPLFYRKRDREGTLTLSPLWLERVKGQAVWRALLPLFYHRRDADSSLTLTPLGSAGRKGEWHWSTLIPLYYHSADDEAGTSRLVTPLAARLSSPDKTRWILIPLVSTAAWGKGEKEVWALGPLVHARWGGDRLQHHVLPLYYWDREAKLFLSPLLATQGGKDKGFVNVATFLAHYERERDGRRRLFLPWVPLQEQLDWPWPLQPLAASWKGQEKDFWFLFPLARARWGGDRVQHHVLPLYYYDADGKLFLSPLFSRRAKEQEAFVNLGMLLAHYTRDAAGRKRLYLPALLSGAAWEKGETAVWALGPLAHAEWGASGTRHHLLPLYYYDGKERLFLSPLLSRQAKEKEGFVNLGVVLAHYARHVDGRRGLLVPPLLSGITWRKDETSLRLLASLAAARWGTKGTRHYVLPLYYYDAAERKFLSLLVSIQDKADRGFVNVLGLVAHVSREPDGRRRLSVLWPFAHAAWGGPRGESSASVLPLFSWHRTRVDRTEERGPDAPKARVQGDSGWWWALPWFWSEWEERRESPAAGAEGETRATSRRRNGAFPLWSYTAQRMKAVGGEQEEDTRQSYFRLLGWLYDRRTRAVLKPRGDEEPYHYVRSRVLWRVMHYEWLDGDSSLDVFPFITWDRKEDGSRQFSFFWRLFRTARDADGGRKLDVLFLPVLRRKGEVAAATATR